jgi:hypothetical protein
VPLEWISDRPEEIGKPYRLEREKDVLTDKPSWFEGVFAQAYSKGWTRSTAREAAEIVASDPKGLRAYDEITGAEHATNKAHGSTPEFEELKSAFRRAAKKAPDEAAEYALTEREGLERRRVVEHYQQEEQKESGTVKKAEKFISRNKEILGAIGLGVFVLWLVSRRGKPNGFVAQGSYGPREWQSRAFTGNQVTAPDFRTGIQSTSMYWPQLYDYPSGFDVY